jgi:hypothetical protein
MSNSKCISTYYIPKGLRESFRNFAKRIGKSASEAIAEAMIEYMRNHSHEIKGSITINVINPTMQNITYIDKVVMKASVFESKKELERLVGLVNRVKDNQAKQEFLVELAKCIQKAYKVYQQTNDKELGELLAKCGEIL